MEFKAYGAVKHLHEIHTLKAKIVIFFPSEALEGAVRGLSKKRTHNWMMSFELK